MSNTGKRGRIGRPRMADEPMRQIAIRLPDEILEAVDGIIAERHGQADRTAVIRELLMDAITRRGKRR